MRVVLILAAGSAMLAACATTEPETGLSEDVRFACDAARVGNLVGQTASQGLGAEAVRVAGARTLRWIAPGQAVTMDYRTDRLNLHLDGQNRVTRVTCG